MNTSSCCEKPRKYVSVSARWGTRIICNNCGKPWKEVKESEDWRVTFDEKFTALEFAGAEVTRKAVKDFIESEKLKSYEEGLKEGYGVGAKDHYKVGYDEGVQFGRALEETETEAPGSYKKGYEEGQDDTNRKLNSGRQMYQAGRAEIIAEILAEWPQEQIMIDEKCNWGDTDYNSNTVRFGINEALRTTRAIIESKRTTK